MKLIILNEKQNAGKSSVIRNVRNLLLKNKGKVLWEYPNGLPLYINPIKYNRDIISIIDYKDRIVGLCSKGDAPRLIQEWFYNLFYHLGKMNKKFDVLVCASRNYDGNACNNLKAIMNYINYYRVSKDKKTEMAIYSLNHHCIYKKGKIMFDVPFDSKTIFSNI